MKTINIRKDLIDKELSRDGLMYHKFHLHNSLINKLYKHYDCKEMVENFYDDEPDYDDEEHSRYMSYDSILRGKPTKYHEIDCSKEDLLQAYINIMQQRRDYDKHRIEFCNWQEPFFDGNWGMTQKRVNNIAKGTLEDIRKCNVSKKERLYITENADEIRIYFYGRDFWKKDFWFIFKRKGR